MSPSFVGSIFIFAGNYQINDQMGWQFCNGQTVAIQQNEALFTLIGTTYGGNGTTTFNLPDLRGRVAINQGQGPGLSNYVIGQASGTETVTLNSNQMPSHTHLINVNTATGSSATPVNGASYLAGSGGTTPPGNLYNSGASNATLSNASIQATGQSNPISIVQPVLATSYLIAMFGIFPSRN
jgi:microcystin-dependent protein